MTEEKINFRIHLPVEALEEKIGASVNGVLPQYKTIVSPRDIERIEGVFVLKKETLQALIRHIPLRGDPNHFPYKNSIIEAQVSEPDQLRIGQTFLSRQKVFDIMTNLPAGICKEYGMSGFGGMPPLEVYGRNSEELPVIALYIPPIIEVHDYRPVLLDGIHRSFISRGAMSTIKAIQVSKVDAPLPFTPITWGSCSPVYEKPPKNKRYHDLNMDLFRDLTAVGIDG
jgi:hypothetical protein